MSALRIFLVAFACLVFTSLPAAAQTYGDDLEPGREMHDWLEAGAKKGNAEKQYFLGGMYGTGGVGDFVRIDEKAAFKWYEKAAIQGYAPAQTQLGYHYFYGFVVEENEGRSRAWYRKAAGKGDEIARAALRAFPDAEDYSDSVEMERDILADMQTWLEKHAGYGKADFQHVLGLFHYMSDDEKKVLQWLEKSAAQGYAPAQRMLGYLYYYGYGGARKNEAMAVEMYNAAARQGDAFAQNALGIIAYFDEDTALAEEWFIKAAKLDFTAAQTNLGGLYSDGERLKRNFVEARKWYIRAAEKGEMSAQYGLGDIYYKGGDGIGQDMALARRWYTKAAEQGWPDAQEMLGRMCKAGEGDKADPVMAYLWLNLALKSASNPAFLDEKKYPSIARANKKTVAEVTALLNELKPEMTAAQLSKGKDLLAEWEPRYQTAPEQYPDAKPKRKSRRGALND